MKWFCRIFSLYVLALSCIPCSDGEHADDGQKAGIATTYLTAAHNSSDHEHCRDVCTPFCGCQCCSVTFTLRAFSEMEIRNMVQPAQKQIFPDLSCRVNELAFAIDHPPQLV